MNQNAKKWVEDLRTTEAKQGRGFLNLTRDNVSYFCCLGIACELYIREGNDLRKTADPIFTEKTFYGVESYSGTLPEKVRVWLGLRTPKGRFETDPSNYVSLVALNDLRNKTFKEIADIIEANEKELFYK